MSAIQWQWGDKEARVLCQEALSGGVGEGARERGSRVVDRLG